MWLNPPILFIYLCRTRDAEQKRASGPRVVFFLLGGMFFSFSYSIQAGMARGLSRSNLSEQAQERACAAEER